MSTYQFKIFRNRQLKRLPTIELFEQMQTVDILKGSGSVWSLDVYICLNSLVILTSNYSMFAYSDDLPEPDSI